MSEDRSSFRQIIKSTSIYGGVQVFQILISLVRSKFVALFLGPAGMGISGLLTSTMSLIESLAGLGINTSAVRDVADVNQSGNPRRVGGIVYTVQILVSATGVLGMLITLLCSGWLSRITFGSEEYRYAFVFLGVTILLNHLVAGLSAVMRGLRFISAMAKATVLGSLSGLLISIPLYYLMGNKGIVPAIILSSFASFLVTFVFYKKSNVQVEKLPLGKVFKDGRRMIVLGFFLSLSGLITMASSYILRIFINNDGGVEDVGYYNAGFAVINSYVGMIFTAMSMDYFPRLVEVVGDEAASSKLVNEQSEVSLFFLAPFLCVFIVFIEFVVMLLYSKDFFPMNEMMQWAAIGMFFKALSWATAFIILAKGDTRVFFWNELLANVYMLLLNIAAYNFWGLSGLGISFLLGYFLYCCQIYVICRVLYRFQISGSVVRFCLIQVALSCLCLISSVNLEGWPEYVAGIFIVSLSLLISARYLKKRVGMNEIVSWVRGRVQKRG